MNKLYLYTIVSLVTISMYSCGNNPGETSNSDGQPTKPAIASGADIYKKTCITCHQANGEGIPNTFPPLAKSDFLRDKEKTITQVIKGFTGELVVNGQKYNSVMPAQQLNDDEIAAVLTYVTSNFGNSGNAVTASEVKEVRAKL